MSMTATGSLVTDLMDLVKREGYGPGDRLPSIRELSATLGVGRNAVRDGLLEAQTMGFLKVEPRLGVFVQTVNGPTNSLSQTIEMNLAPQAEQNLFHLIDARLLIEVELVGEAARLRRPEELLPLRQILQTVLESHEDRLAFIRADEAFHLGIARIAGNHVLQTFLQTVLGLLRPAKMGVLLSSANRERTDQEHQELFRGLLDGDVERVQAIMRAHLTQGRSLLLQHLRTMPQSRTHSSPAENPPC